MDHKDISYVVFESICSRFERTIKRLWILIILLTVLLVGTNCVWLLYESQFETVETTTEEYTSDAADGGVAIANGDGEVNVNG
jgi:hypothetical protein